MQNLLIVTLIAATVALGACRREEPRYEPLKLGATAGTTHASR